MSDSIREDLARIGAYRRNLPTVQAEKVREARDAGMTWREIATLLDMTETGLLKAQKKAGGR